MTDDELTMLRSIAQRGGFGTRVPFVNPFASKKAASGVCGSLSRKGLAHFDPMSVNDDRTMIMTERGFDALRAADGTWPESLRLHYREAEKREAIRVRALKVENISKQVAEARGIAFREEMARRAGKTRLTDKQLEQIARSARAQLDELEQLLKPER